MLIAICFLTLYALSCKGDDASDTAAGTAFDSELSPTPVALVPFSGGFLSVWGQLKVDGRYYVQPLAYFKRGSAAVRQNYLTNVNQVTFKVIMWSEEAHEAVYRHIKRHLNSTAQKSQVLPLPTEKLRICWKGHNEMHGKFELADNWRSNTHRPVVIMFKFQCKDREDCNELASNINNNPSNLDGLEIEYVVKTKSTVRRVVTVRTEHITTGNLFANIVNKVSTDDFYLNSEDVKKMASETARKVVASVTEDAEYVASKDEIEIKDVVLANLKQHEISSANFQSQMWESVFWDQDWARPDKLTNTLNEILTVRQNDSDNFYLKETDHNSVDTVRVKASILNFSAEGSGSSTESEKAKVNRKEVLNRLDRFHNTVKFTGEKFEVKPLKLYRLVKSKLRQSTEFASTSLQIKKYEAIRNIRLRLDDDSANASSGLTPELVQSRLTDKIEAIKGSIKTELSEGMSRVDSKISEERGNVRRLFNDISSKLGTWPSGHYCIWNNGDCPEGFVRKGYDDIRIKSYRRLLTCSSGSTFFGSSYAYRYSNCDHKLNIFVCCK